MASFTRELLKWPTSRLSRRIVIWIFFSVVAIEAIILVPSYLHRKAQLLDQLKELSVGQVTILMTLLPQDTSTDELLSQFEHLSSHSIILGGTLYSSTGIKFGSFGETPTLNFSDAYESGHGMRLSVDGTRYDIACGSLIQNPDYRLILRHDATSVQKNLTAYVARIAGLVLIISIVVTAGAFIALGPIVVTPILRLRNDLLKAGEAISKDRKATDFYAEITHRDDELGDVIAAFKQMYHQITAAISHRKKAEAALQKSLRQVENYSQVLNDELETGRKMQKNFLPYQLLQKPGWEMAAYFKPARQVAGDFYDLFDLPDKRLGIVVADVCDKGVGAALFMALFRSLIRVFSGQTDLNGLKCDFSQPQTSHDSTSQAGPATDPLRAVRYTNDYIARNHGELAMFATLFFGILDTDSGQISYISGGHDPLFILPRNGTSVKTLEPTGPAVGIVEGNRFMVRETIIEPGEILFGYTDGVIEAHGGNGVLFSKERLLSALQKNKGSAAELIENIKKEVLEHTGSAELFDDITMLALRRTP